MSRTKIDGRLRPPSEEGLLLHLRPSLLLSRPGLGSHRGRPTRDSGVPDSPSAGPEGCRAPRVSVESRRCVLRITHRVGSVYGPPACSGRADEGETQDDRVREDPEERQETPGLSVFVFPTHPESSRGGKRGVVQGSRIKYDPGVKEKHPGVEVGVTDPRSGPTSPTPRSRAVRTE